jgi:hypothetical protein
MSVKYVQIPTTIVRNEDGHNITNNAFALCVILKNLAFTERTNALNITNQELKYRLGISDNRTIKDALVNLHENRLINEKYERLPIRSEMTLTLTEHDGMRFTQLPIGIISRLKGIGIIGLRLLFLYESYIQRKGAAIKQFAFPSFERISEILGISTATISKYNSQLEALGLLVIRRHNIKADSVYDEQDKLVFSRFNNHYYPQLVKMVADEK